MVPRFKQENPRLLFGSVDDPPLFGFWSGLDYGEAQEPRKYPCFPHPISIYLGVDRKVFPCAEKKVREISRIGEGVWGEMTFLIL